MGDWTQNPFAAADSDPFNDPSVTSINSSKVPEYNPFEGSATQAPTVAATRDVVSSGAASIAQKSKPVEDDKPSWAEPKPVQQSAPVQAPVQTQPAPAPAPVKAAAKPATKVKASTFDSPDDIQRKQEFEKRENLANPRKPKADPNYRPSNWPPFHEKCPSPFKPCFHHDFEGEIPQFGYRVAREAYYFWLLTFVAYTWNFVCCLATLNTNYAWTGATAGVSSAYFVLGAPCAYCCWFQPLYNAFRLDSSVRYGWFFFAGCFQLLMSAFLSIGFPSTGGAGFWTATECLSQNEVIGIMLYSSALLWALDALWILWILKKVMFIYRTTGQTLDKAQGEARGIVNQAAFDAVTSNAGQAVVKSAAQTAWEQQASQA